MGNPYTAVVMRIPDEHFAENDELCLKAGKYVCSLLEPFLVGAGHQVPEYVRGGVEEDWGVYFESQLGNEKFDYTICFFTSDVFEPEAHMSVQYGPKPSWRHLFFGKVAPLPDDHPLHRTMRDFGATFEFSLVMTEAEFRAAM